jgi:hypothetical protein
VDASAGQDVGHSNANPWPSLAEARGCPSAWGRDSLSVKAATERPVATVVRAATEQHRVRRRGERQKAVYQP